MKKTGILYDNISGNTGDVAIGLSLKKILKQLNIEFDELIPGNFNPLDYETILIGGGYLLRESPDFFYDKFKVRGNHILNAVGIYGEPKDLDYLKSYKNISVRSNGDKKKLEYLDKEIKVIPCTTMLLDDIPDLPFNFQKPCIGIHIFPIFTKEEENEFINWISSLPFYVYFIPITHYNKDIQYMRDLQEKIPNSEVLPILKAQEIFTICGKFDYFICCSLHGAIFSYVHNTPFILFNSQDKMQFFMEDRQLDYYLFKNFKELKYKFEELIRKKPDYSNKVIEDKKILADYVNYLSSVLPLNQSKHKRNQEVSFETTHQITYLLSDISGLERENSIFKKQISELSQYSKSLEAGISDREKQISELAQYSKSLEAGISDREEQISELAQYSKSLEAGISDREKQISELSQYSKSLEGGMSDREKQILEFSQQIKSLKVAISDQEKKISEISQYSKSLEETISDQEKQILELSQQIKTLEVSIFDREKQISEVTPYARHLEQEISAKQRHITDLTNHYLTLKLENDTITESITYQLSNKFHRRIVEKILPRYSRQRKYYDLFLKGGRLFCNKGWKESYNFFRNTKDTRKNENTLQNDVENQQYPEKTDSVKDSFKIELYEKLDSFLSNPQKKLIFPIYRHPIVSIIILTFNKSEYTYQCLTSLSENCDIPFEVIIVDNGSTDTTSRLLNKVENIVPILNQQNMGFVLGCNEGAKKAKGKYLLFLNNDTVVTKNWLSRLVSTLEKYPDCGAVGGKLVLPNGQLQEAGSVIWNDGSTSGYGRGDDPQKPEYSYVREVEYCSGACLLIRSEEFQKLGGFDIRYIPAYYEDADLCMELQNRGKKIIYQPEVTIFHHEFTSSSMVNAKNSMINNKSKFIEKWKNCLHLKEKPSPSNILTARDIRNGKKILILDDRIPDSSQGSGFPRANKLLSFLGELGYKVTFFPMDKTIPYQPYTMVFQQLGIEVFYGDNLDFLKFAQQRAGFYNVVIISRPHNFEKHYNTVKSFFPTAFLIYDAEALFSTRDLLKAKIEGKVLNNEEIKNLRNREIDLMKKADLVITVSENEKNIILENGGPSNIAIFSHSIIVQDEIKEFNSRENILFIGSFLAPNGPNDDAILYFIKEIWPKIQERVSCKLYVVGFNPPESLKQFSSSSIIITGYVQNLKQYYDKCRIFIVPHRYAAGIPLKLLEAMSYGIPSVISELIASELNIKDGKEVLIAGDPDEFARKIICLYQNEALWKMLQLNSIEFIKENFNPEKSRRIIKDMIERGCKN